MVRAVIELANRIRKFITSLIAAAIALVNRLATLLRQIVADLLNAIAKMLSDILNILKKMLQDVIKAVVDAIKTVLDYASKLLGALGDFMLIAVDFLDDPGGWLSGAKNSAVDGAKHHLFREVQAAVKQWFQSKIEEIIGVPRAIIDRLIKGGFTLEKIVKETWDAVVPQLPFIIGEIVITKVIAKLIPGAGWAMAVIDAIRTAIGALGEILRAIGAVITWLKAVRSGGAGLLFAKAVAAGVVALLELAYEALMSGIGKYVAKVGKRLKGVAAKLGKGGKGDGKGPAGHGSDDKSGDKSGDEGAPKTTPTPTATTPKPGTKPTPAPKPDGKPGTKTDPKKATGTDKNGQPKGDKDAPSKPDTRPTPTSKPKPKPRPKPKPDSDTKPKDTTPGKPKDDKGTRDKPKDDAPGADKPKNDDKDPDKPKDQDPTKPKDDKNAPGKPKPDKDPDGKRPKPKDGKDGKDGKPDDGKKAKPKPDKDGPGRPRPKPDKKGPGKSKPRPDKSRPGRPKSKPDKDRQKKDENSKKSKDERLRKIVARIRPRLFRVMRPGIRRSGFLSLLKSMKFYYRLTGLAPVGGDPFTVVASLNPSLPVLDGDYSEPRSEPAAYSVPPGAPTAADDLPKPSLPTFHNGRANTISAEFLSDPRVKWGTEAGAAPPGKPDGWGYITDPTRQLQENGAWVRAHLLPSRLGGLATGNNLVPARRGVNKDLELGVEMPAWNAFKKKPIWYESRVKFGNSGSIADIPTYIRSAFGRYDKIRGTGGKRSDWQRTGAEKTLGLSIRPPQPNEKDTLYINTFGSTQISDWLKVRGSMAEHIVKQRLEEPLRRYSGMRQFEISLRDRKAKKGKRSLPQLQVAIDNLKALNRTGKVDWDPLHMDKDL